MRNSLRLIILLVCLVACSACTLPWMTEKRNSAALDDFMYALRWQRFNAAAGFMRPELRPDFLALFANNKNLNIVDVRLVEVTITEAGQRTEAILEMDYYLLPSITLKTLRIPQTWASVAQEGQKIDHGNTYQIVSPFPPFP